MKKNKKINFRSDCSVSSILDLIGDKWSLLILRDMLLNGKHTFKEFANSDENISTSVLTNRLTKLEDLEILCKYRHTTNKKVFEYFVTEKGADLLPILVELIVWSGKYLKDHINIEAQYLASQLVNNKELVVAQIKKDIVIR